MHLHWNSYTIKITDYKKELENEEKEAYSLG